MTDLTARLNIKMTDEEYKQLRSDAFKHEMTISDYIRYLIEKERKTK